MKSATNGNGLPTIQLCDCGSFDPYQHAYLYILKGGEESPRGPFASVEAGKKWIAAGVAAFDAGDPTGLNPGQATALTVQLETLGLPVESGDVDARIVQGTINRIFAFRTNFPIGMAEVLGPDGLAEFFADAGVVPDPNGPGSEPIWNYDSLRELPDLNPADFQTGERKSQPQSAPSMNELPFELSELLGATGGGRVRV